MGCESLAKETFLCIHMDNQYCNRFLNFCQERDRRGERERGRDGDESGNGQASNPLSYFFNLGKSFVYIYVYISLSSLFGQKLSYISQYFSLSLFVLPLFRNLPTPTYIPFVWHRAYAFLMLLSKTYHETNIIDSLMQLARQPRIPFRN